MTDLAADLEIPTRDFAQQQLARAWQMRQRTLATHAVDHLALRGCGMLEIRWSADDLAADPWREGRLAA